MYLIETIIYCILAGLRSAANYSYFNMNTNIIDIIMAIALVLGIIPIITKIVQRGIKSLTIGYNISHTNLIGWLCNLVLYILTLAGIPYVIYVLLAINVILLAIDIIKMVTGREILK